MKLKFLGLSIILVSLLSCTPAHVKQAKIYENELQSMMEKNSKEVVSKIETSWDFKLARAWKATDPGSEAVLKNTRWETAFSKQEVEQIFSPKGKYEVMLYSKFLRKDIASTQEITPMGTSGWKTAEHEAERYAYIRVVFRDGQLVHFKVLPIL
jgi:hypothetical protein